MQHFACSIFLTLLCTIYGARVARPSSGETSSAQSMVQINTVNMQNSSEFEVASAHLKAKQPTWTLSYKMVPCALKDDRSQLEPFVKGLKKTWGKKDADVVAEANKLARDQNCRLCNIDVKGSILPVKVANSDPWREVTVTCASEPINVQNTCFTENGNVGKWHPKRLSPRGLCAPCPKECDRSCEAPGTTDSGYWSSTWFKCKLTTPRNLATSGESVFQKGKKVFTTPSGYDCEQTTFKSLAKSTPEALGAPGSQDDSSLAPKVSKRSDFATTGEFKLWCKYKSDFSKDVADEKRSPPVVRESTWTFSSGFVQCSKASLNDDGSMPFVTPLAQHAVPFLLQTARKENCEICELTIGGAMTTVMDGRPLQEAFSQMQVLPDGSATPGAELSIWMQPSCATRQLGRKACNPSQGMVGKPAWIGKDEELNNSCKPCPPECMSCEVIPGKKGATPTRFKCILLPLLAFPNPTLVSLTDDNIFEDAPKDVYNLPKGYDCDVPKPRNCRGKGWCTNWQFKTECDFPEDFTQLHQ